MYFVTSNCGGRELYNGAIQVGTRVNYLAYQTEATFSSWVSCTREFTLAGPRPVCVGNDILTLVSYSLGQLYQSIADKHLRVFTNTSELCLLSTSLIMTLWNIYEHCLPVTSSCSHKVI